MKNILFLVTILVCSYGCQPIQKPTKTPEILFITTAPDVKLEVIDWGGNGEPILFLAGLGNSAHIFDDFAPRFNDQYHVYGLTRRGFGESSKPDYGYDIQTLTKDILTVLDSLKIKKVNLIGHSISGEELTKFAVLYPDRVNKLIYLDAAYDRTDLSHYDNAPSCPWDMTGKDSSSIVDFQNYLTKMFGVRFPLSEIKASNIFDEKQHYQGDITPDTAYVSIMTIFERPAYESIKTPALALFSVTDSVQSLFPCYNDFDSIQRKAARDVYQIDQSFAKEQMNIFRSKMQNGRVKEVHANHHLFISNAKEVEKEIRDFLAE